MNFEINPFALIILLGSLQGIFLASILVFNKRFKKKSNIFLSIFILAFSLSNLHYVSHLLGFTENRAWFVYLSFPWTLLIPIVFYFFVKYLIRPDYQMSSKEKWLFLPFALQLIFYTTLFVLEISGSKLIESYLGPIRFILGNAETVLSLLLNLIFIPLILKMILDYEKTLKENYSEISKSSIQWIRKLIFVLIGIWILWALPAIYQIFTGIQTPKLDYLLWIAMSVCIYWIGYEVYFRNDIFQAKQNFPSKQKKNTPKPASDKIDDYYHRMLSLLEKEKLFTDPEFDLSMLAAKCELSPNYLSQIINSKSGQNFYNLINDYRIKQVKTLLRDPEYAHYSILSIGLEAGFKSKASFFKVFKSKTGMTPSQFKNQIPTD